MDERYFRTESQQGVDRQSREARASRVFQGESRLRPMRSQEPQQQPQPAQPSFNGNYVPQPQQNGGVVIHSPSTYEDVQRLIDHLKRREQVIVNFASVNQTSVYRILDFMSGAIYALGGSIQQITGNIFLFAPAGVTITIPPQFEGRR